MLSVGHTSGRFTPGPRTPCEPPFGELEVAGRKVGGEGDSAVIEEFDRRSEAHNCSRPAVRRRWGNTARPGFDVSAQEVDEPQDQSETTTKASLSSGSRGGSGRILWMLGKRGVEMSLPTGTTRSISLPVDIKAGSRAVGAGMANEIFILENGSSRLWHLRLGAAAATEELTFGVEARRFRSSLGSRLLFLSGHFLLVTGTPGQGAHTPWLFDLKTKGWTRLPDAPHPILSSAVVADGDMITVIGGWSKQRSCHGHTQVLRLTQPFEWRASPVGFVPWRRPGASCLMRGFGVFLALGWMECQGEVGNQNFRLLRRDGSAQRARTSSSRLCRVEGSAGNISEISQMPFADSFENNGEIYQMGENVVCVGRDGIQAFNVLSATWQTWQLPRQLSQDSSNSWVKHCGSWALVWLP